MLQPGLGKANLGKANSAHPVATGHVETSAAPGQGSPGQARALSPEVQRDQQMQGPPGSFLMSQPGKELIPQRAAGSITKSLCSLRQVYYP